MLTPACLVIFHRGDVVLVKKPSKLRFATVTVNVTSVTSSDDTETLPTTIPVLYLEEIQAVDCLTPGTTPSGIASREVHFFTHVSKKIMNVRCDQLVRTDGRCQVVEWENRDIWDHMANGTFVNISLEDYMQRPGPGAPLPGVRGTIFLLDKAIFQRYREEAGFETREVEKRSLLWPTNPIDERPMKKRKL